MDALTIPGAVASVRAFDIDRHVRAFKRERVLFAVRAQFDGDAALIHSRGSRDVTASELALNDDGAVDIRASQQRSTQEHARQ